MSFEGAVLPDYAGRSLANLLPSVGAHLGLGHTDVLGLPDARAYLVLMVDGFGWRQLQEHVSTAEFLGATSSGPVTCGVPSTTATSLTSLGTGRPPGAHGMVGYRFRNPASGEVMNALSWENGPDDVATLQPHPTIYSALPGESAAIALARFNNSGLTRASLAGATMIPVIEEDDHAARIDQAVEATRGNRLVYCYERLLDHTGHTHGVGSWQWLDRLAAVDDLAAELRATLDDDVCILVTGDHGMVNTVPGHTLVIEDEPDLGGFDELAGEARFRHLYTDRPTWLAARYAEALGDRAWVFTREEGIEAGLFGTVAPRVLPSLGDVMVAMREDWVLMTRTHPVEMTLAGVHGSLTAEEMLVPLITLPGRP